MNLQSAREQGFTAGSHLDPPTPNPWAVHVLVWNRDPALDEHRRALSPMAAAWRTGYSEGQAEYARQRGQA
ncbi:hypothetical protein AB0F91_43795 [Amycolatopsis sp. NPDC023774]|uniref:hypothetical protein n=1 Tax=Amycolatopsis sp. NPDC023774 TaxID=3155015 RepID=UPI0033E0CA77